MPVCKSAVILLAIVSTANSQQICDDTGYCHQFAKPAERIVALYGAFNEMLIALDATEAIVARTDADSRLEPIAALPAIGTHMRPNPELILACRPDVVLQMCGRGETSLQTEFLRKAGIPVLCFEIDSFEKLFSAMRKLGSITAREKEAVKLVESWKQRLEAISIPPEAPRVYYEIREPVLLAAGGRNIITDIIRAAGGENIISAPVKMARFNEEALLLANPDFCIAQQGPMSPAPVPLTKRPNLANLDCVKNGRNMIVNEREFARPGPQSIDAAEKLARLFAGARQ